MSLPDVDIIIGNGDTGQQPAGQDYVSGMVFYTSSLPSGFSSGARVKMITSPGSANSLGINQSYSDETQAIVKFQITTNGTTGDQVSVVFNEPLAGNVTLCNYTLKNTDSSATITAASIAAAINANSSNTGGYTATASTTYVSVTLRKGLGVWANTNYATLMTFVIVSGTMVIAAPTLPTAGVASLLAVWYYHISEFFRLNPTGVLWVGFFAVPASASAYNFNEVQSVQNASSGAVRQISVFVNNPNGTGGSSITNLSTLQAWVASSIGLLQGQKVTLYNQKTPLNILFACDMTLSAGIANLTLDLSTLTGDHISFVISQDGANQGYYTWATTGFSITDIGAKLGAVSSVAVSDSIADVGEVNMTNGAELSVPAFFDGTLYSTLITVDGVSFANQLDTWRYCFLRTFTGQTGTYNNNDHTCVVLSNQFNYIRKGRTFDKAYRLLYPAYLPYLNGKLKLNSNGTLANTTVATLQNVGNEALDPMVRSNDLSGYTVVVPANQNPNNTGILNITVNLLGVPVAMQINVTSQFVNSL